ncbi:MAG: CPBP family intramembrane metalloprotease [Candidatus Marinimicrobia bacterium]|nr:CPBP family intramembrane metalloprotease [Candidatus Neomarinimicrobiota bacterium]
MDRTEALDEASKLALQYDWGPKDFEQASVFNLHSKVQNFVELEQGGTEAFSKMLAGSLYAPYIWQVRHYKENKANETMIRFTPEGRPYGFREKLPEDKPGASLTSDSALAIARTMAGNNWGVNLDDYNLVERSHEVKPGGRTDHSFVYERRDTTIGKGKYRLRLKVSGNKFTELTHFVKVPEAFSRRYSQMRSANQTLYTVAMVAMIVFYLIGGCIIGLFILMKQNWVIWRKALLWGGLIALFQVLAQINQWPLLWMDYDTALSAQGFVIQQIIQLVIIFIAEGLLLSITFMAAESLTRKAFPEHVQLWQVWKPKVASSPGIFGRTIGGYLAVGIFLAFDIGLYFFATHILGWWVPSDTLFEPNVLATYFPWLSSIAISLHAGFWEECLFRAVPIAGAALLGERFGKKRLWIIGAFIVQALIFGAAHASYPMQPSYARLVELIIPSIGFGLIYLHLGLLPAIILHYVFDVVHISMPLFAASTAGIWVDRLIVILLTLIPLLIVIWRRLQVGKFNKIPDWAYNASWQPAEEKDEKIAAQEIEEKFNITAGNKRYLYILFTGIVGLLIWVFTMNFDNMAPRIETTRQEAKNIAIDSLSRQGVELTDSIRVLAYLQTPHGKDDRFIWQEEGKQTYKQLLGKYLSTPVWQVRFAQFEGNVAARAEEYRIYVKSGKVLNVEHKLPESYPGAELTEDSAQARAYSVIEKRTDLDPNKLKKVGAKPSDLPERKDWLFEFADTLNYNLSSGEPRIVIKLAGSEVVNAYRKVHIPEDWQREQRSQNNQRQIIMILCGIILFILLAIGAIKALIRWSRNNFATKEFLIFLIFIFFLGLAKFLNSLPGLMANFETSQPFSNQLFMMTVLPVIGILLMAAAVALINGLIKVWKPEQKNNLEPVAILSGFFTGFLIAGIGALLEYILGPNLNPLWADYAALNSYLPFLATGLNPIQSFIINSTLLILIFTAISRFTVNWTKRRLLFAFIILVVILVVKGLNLETIPFWIISGLVVGVIYLVIYIVFVRYRLDLIPLIVGGSTILHIMQQLVFNAYPTAIIGNLIAILLITLIAIYWSKKLA